MKRFLSSLSTALSILFIVISISPVYAATTKASSNSAGSAPASSYSSAGLSIDPRKNYIINPGQTVHDTLTIGNLDTTSGLSITLRMIDFTFTDNSGTPKLYLAANHPNTPWSLKPYTTLPGSVLIGPGETKTINYSITIPKKLGAGSYYSAILYESGEGTGGNVGLGASGVSLVFVTVPGVVNENMTLQKFGAYASPDSGTSGGFVYIATSAPQMMAYELKNNGNVAEAPAGSITLKNMFGKQVSTIGKTNSNQDLALIGQTRLFATCIESQQNEITKLGGSVSSADAGNTCITAHLTPGLYTATLDSFYGQNGNVTHEVTGTAHFWYLPWWFIAVVFVILAALALAIWWVQRKIRALIKGSTYHSGKGISRRG
jgi:hypothetical protein